MIRKSTKEILHVYQRVKQIISNRMDNTSSLQKANVMLVMHDSLEKAQFYYSINHFGRAFAHYLVYLELCPNGRASVLKEFMDTLYNWTNILETLGQYEDLIKCYLQGINYYPSNVEIINNFGAHLIRLYISASLNVFHIFTPSL